ncbi:MAG: DNA methylase, partial [Crocosphaera sp.]
QLDINELIPDLNIPIGEETERLPNIGIEKWSKLFNPRQLLTLVTYLEIINEAKTKLHIEYEPEKVEAICTYLSLLLDRCIDKSSRLCCWDSSVAVAQKASVQHSLNLMWNYPEFSGIVIWNWCNDVTSKYT